METQSEMMIPLVIYNQMRLRPCGSLLDYSSWGDCQVLTPSRFPPPTHCGLSPHHLHPRSSCSSQIPILVSLLCNFQTHLKLSFFIWSVNSAVQLQNIEQKPIFDRQCAVFKLLGNELISWLIMRIINELFCYGIYGNQWQHFAL